MLKVFVDLYDKGYIYRDRYLVNWDPGSRSAISDLEVESREVTDTLFYIDYPLASGSGAITVATVRPETMLADVAIAVNPNDERYQRLIGETAILPIVGRRLKIIADDYVKTEFGTGALKITPGHDPNDFEIGHRHHLPHPSVIGEDGRMEGDGVPDRYLGMKTADARAAIVAELDDLGLIRQREVYTHKVPFSNRSGEPHRAADLPAVVHDAWTSSPSSAIDVVKSGQIKFHSRRAGPRSTSKLDGEHPAVVHLRAQLCGDTRSRSGIAPVRPTSATTPPEGDGWERDPDVLDTWFSSGLWPFATLGWPEQTPELEAFYPTDALQPPDATSSSCGSRG